MLFQQSSPLMTKQSLEVSAKGELVVLRIGNADLPMHYEQALDISRWVRQEGQAIKRGTGRAVSSRSLGVLADADAKAKPMPYTAGTAIHSKPKLQSWRRENVWAQGRIVNITIGGSTLNLHFESALKVAQWLRVRAKEARNTAGDTRHWSEITGDK
jgi:hypothetical protein